MLNTPEPDYLSKGESPNQMDNGKFRNDITVVQTEEALIDTKRSHSLKLIKNDVKRSDDKELESDRKNLNDIELEEVDEKTISKK